MLLNLKWARGLMPLACGIALLHCASNAGTPPEEEETSTSSSALTAACAPGYTNVGEESPLTSIAALGCIDAINASGATAPARTATCTGAKTQSWLFAAVAPGAYQIHSAAFENVCLSGRGAAVGSAVVRTVCSDDAAEAGQTFVPYAMPERAGAYLLQEKSSGLCIQVSGTSATASLVFAACAPEGADRAFALENTTSCRDIDECQFNGGGCAADATCANTPGSYTCTCPAGSTGDGKTCTVVERDPCEGVTCGANESCSTVSGSCACKLGYKRWFDGTCVKRPTPTFPDLTDCPCGTIAGHCRLTCTPSSCPAGTVPVGSRCVPSAAATRCLCGVTGNHCTPCERSPDLEDRGFRDFGPAPEPDPRAWGSF